jgi:hypothetical protein
VSLGAHHRIWVVLVFADVLEINAFGDVLIVPIHHAQDAEWAHGNESNESGGKFHVDEARRSSEKRVLGQLDLTLFELKSENEWAMDDNEMMSFLLDSRLCIHLLVGYRTLSQQAGCLPDRKIGKSGT